MGRRLFGTDGVRGRVGELLTADLARSIGSAAMKTCGVPGTRCLVIRDTRESGPMLSDAFARGAAERGAAVTLGGVLPTPAAPLLIGTGAFDMAAVVSASHNPYEDNGIKIFGRGGLKLDDAQETEIEAELESVPDEPARGGSVTDAAGLGDRYVAAMLEHYGALDLTGRRLVIDCAQGATFEVAPRVFRALGADVTVIGDRPDGRNINDGFGSTSPAALQHAMSDGSFDAGFAFDGDGDRLIAVASDGRVLDGDELIAMVALSLHERGALRGGVAVTVMSNLGLRIALAREGIEVVSTDVGDRHVLAELRSRGWRLGGEQSGHIIDMDLVPSGDGLGSALLVLDALGGHTLSTASAIDRLPQVLINVPVADRQAAVSDPAVATRIAEIERELAGSGRVLVRPSGTEQLVRVMTEAPTEQQAQRACTTIAELIATAHGR